MQPLTDTCGFRVRNAQQTQHKVYADRCWYDAGFTLRTYTHATNRMQERAAATMGNLISQAM